MQEQSERRVSGVRRVAVERVVDVCERDRPATTFRGRSLDISGRGMQLWADHLPELGTQLVLRFHDQGQEIIAEGEVAWCNAGEGGAEFGVRFTALDSRSVQALKALCRVELAEAAPAPGPALADAELDEQAPDTDPAPPVAPILKLHIEGLGEPMRAQIRAQRPLGLDVGSQLTFLRLGRSVEVEDPTLGDRRPARIAGVDVHVDPGSQVPELIVSMRYSETAATPAPVRATPRSAPAAREAAATLPASSARSPESAARRESEEVASVVTQGDADTPPRENSLADAEPDALDLGADPTPLDPGFDPEGAALGGGELLDADLKEPPEDELEESTPSEVERLREHMEGVLRGATAAARVASTQAVRWGGAASRGAHWLARRARSAVPARERADTTRRRTTAPAVRSALRTNPLLRQPGRSAIAATPRGSVLRRTRGRMLVLAGLFVAAVAAGALLGGGAEESGEHAAGAVVPQPAASPAPATSAAALPAPVSESAAGESPNEELEGAELVAQVPLFGPIGVGEEESNDDEAVPLARVKVSDQTFDPPKKPKPAPQRVASTEFGHGRMHLPIVYRLRLNKPGDGLRGERTPTGFDVFIPGRKTMESGAAISRRDDRIAKVVTRNATDGARVSFRFRGTIPAYKVRLRKDFVEFFISS